MTSLLSLKPVLFVYTDGGPDHRLTYLSVQLSLISLFLTLDLDFLCACRTAPYHSWRNPVERVMSTLNLGLQSVGLMRQEMDEKSESNCNNMKQIRSADEKSPEVGDCISESIEPVKILLSDILRRLQLKGKYFEMFSAADKIDIEDVWNTLRDVDSTLNFSEKHPKACLTKHTAITDFINHCCQQRHYSFCIKKCGILSCKIYKPPRLRNEIFSKINFIPDPIPCS